MIEQIRNRNKKNKTTSDQSHEDDSNNIGDGSNPTNQDVDATSGGSTTPTKAKKKMTLTLRSFKKKGSSSSESVVGDKEETEIEKPEKPQKPEKPEKSSKMDKQQKKSNKVEANMTFDISAPKLTFSTSVADSPSSTSPPSSLSTSPAINSGQCSPNYYHQDNNNNIQHHRQHSNGGNTPSSSQSPPHMSVSPPAIQPRLSPRPLPEPHPVSPSLISGEKPPVVPRRQTISLTTSPVLAPPSVAPRKMPTPPGRSPVSGSTTPPLHPSSNITLQPSPAPVTAPSMANHKKKVSDLISRYNTNDANAAGDLAAHPPTSPQAKPHVPARPMSMIVTACDIHSLHTQSSNTSVGSSNDSVSMNSSSGSVDSEYRRTMRQKMFARKTASMSLRNEGDPEEMDDEYDDVSEESPTIGASFMDPSMSSGSSISLYEDDPSAMATTTMTAAPTATKKKGFFAKRSTVATDQIDPKELIIERLASIEPLISRRSTLPAINNDTSTNKVVKELIETEADYLDDLQILIEYYKSAMVELCPTVSSLKEEDINQVFSNIEELYQVNTHLFSSLVEMIPHMDYNEYPIVDTIFFNHTNALYKYGAYLSLQEQCNKVLTSWENSSHLSPFLNSIKSLPCVKSLNISSYVIKPVQRLCKYPLLLRELKKSVPEEDEHYRSFERAAKLMEKIVSDINNRIKNEEKIAEIRDVIGKEHDELIMNKTLIKEGKLKFYKNSETKGHDATIYLLDDYLLFYRSAFMAKNRLFAIHLACVIDVKDVEKQTKSGLEIMYQSNEQVLRQVVAADNYADKLLWIRDVEDAVHAYRVLSQNWTLQQQESSNELSSAGQLHYQHHQSDAFNE
ncbi:hypothetical protein SAMD00019534_018870 [Acytostelium subglobosum LB1]|uniref:hypothetical protein n=1 Tax=Acytostelium subglobosum LB1 TaxID=1410327 RepID=UPI0006451F16|nr:hypothetical protein SAMD00019534_018870 [Acytostelium subglobosum LB1]GAM18712.1 hypothetical protein SAMD00019534_018870 [Acytostelium subglobosum LB1]|eukprot:XP_012757932.1 hypothetical protein SAMD00019534_018870 [Acytostelium subglobosum LB1]